MKINIIMKMEKNINPKYLDDAKLKAIFEEIIKRIKKKPIGFFKFKKMKSIRGLWCGGDEVLIDHRREIIPTIIHEMLHDIYEDNNEKWVCNVESKITQIISSNDVFTLLTEFFNKMDLPKNKRDKMKEYYEL